MKSTRRLNRNAHGEFVAPPRDSVENTDDQVVPYNLEKRQTMKMVEEDTPIERLAPLHNWRLLVTVNRMQVCILTVSVLMRIISILAIIAFWGSIIMGFKTMTTWDGPQSLLRGIKRRDALTSSGATVPTDDNLWEDLFPAKESMQSYNIKLILADSGLDDATRAYEYSLPLVTHNPLVWTGVNLASVFIYHIVVFLRGFLQRIGRWIKRIERRHVN